MPVGICDLRGPAEDLLAQAEIAAETGYDAFWTNENTTYKDGVTSAAAITQYDGLDIVVGVINPYLRHPALIATMLHSIDDYARQNGGKVKGLALGTGIPEDIQNELGVPFERPVKRMSETYDIITSIMETGECTYDGDIFQLDDWTFRYDFPEQIPIHMTAIGPKMRELAAYKYDGVYLPFNTSIPYTKEVVKEMEENLEEFGRDRDEFTLSANIGACVTSEDSDLTYEEQIDGVQMAAAWHLCSDHHQWIVEQSGLEYDLEGLRTAMRAGDFDKAKEIINEDVLDVVAAVGPAEKVRGKVRDLMDAGLDYPVYINYGLKEPKVRTTRELAPEKL